MANTIYLPTFLKIANNTIDPDSGSTVLRCMLERSTSTYTANPDHEFLDDLTNFVECSVASYARQTVTSKTLTYDSSNNRIEYDFDNIAFGNLETGQIVKGVLFYFQIGGDDTTPEDDCPLLYYDTAGSSLPATLGGGPFVVNINSEGALQAAQA